MAGIYGLDSSGNWAAMHYMDPRALIFSYNNTSVPINMPYNNLGNEIMSCFLDPTLAGDNRLATLRTNYDIGNIIAYNQNPNNIYPFNVDISGIV